MHINFELPLQYIGFRAIERNLLSRSSDFSLSCTDFVQNFLYKNYISHDIIYMYHNVIQEDFYLYPEVISALT